MALGCRATCEAGENARAESNCHVLDSEDEIDQAVFYVSEAQDRMGLEAEDVGPDASASGSGRSESKARR